MSSIWNGATTQAGASPFATTGMAPTPGGGKAAKFQSILQSSGKQAQPAGQMGLSPASRSAAGKASPMVSSGGTGDSSDSDATISANDFLTLLVTEMQNQDPTADTDPNEYINQLVQINSLEQLISINQNLETVLGAASSPTSQEASNQSTPKVGSSAAARQTAGSHGGPSAASTIQSSGASSRPAAVRGNLSTPGDAPAAHKVAHALDGHARAAPRDHAIRDIPTRPLP